MTPSADLQLQRMVSAGITHEVATEITRELDGVATAQLSLRRAATREGWLDTEQYTQALARIPDGHEVIRSRFGDAVFDRYLYSIREPNRVIVESVELDSASGGVGLRKGDMIFSLGNTRVYSAYDLENSQSGTSSVLMVYRSGERKLLEYVVPSGPLGIIIVPGYAEPID